MKVKDILFPMKYDLHRFVEIFGEETSDDDCFYVMIGDDYIKVDMINSYWYHEDDGTIVFRVNDE